jgi:osmotically-inducible protein OsmY
MNGMTSAAADGWITTKVKVRLMAEPGLSPFAINVDTRDGVVSLFGTVESADLKSRAEAEARMVKGVKAVENDLQVAPDVAANRVKSADNELKEAVQERLEARDSLEDSDIDVEVNKGVVRLTGTVETQGDRLTALTLARGTAGVNSVIDALEVKPQG